MAFCAAFVYNHNLKRFAPVARGLFLIVVNQCFDFFHCKFGRICAIGNYMGHSIVCWPCVWANDVAFGCIFNRAVGGKMKCVLNLSVCVFDIQDSAVSFQCVIRVNAVAVNGTFEIGVFCDFPYCFHLDFGFVGRLPGPVDLTVSFF